MARAARMVVSQTATYQKISRKGAKENLMDCAVTIPSTALTGSDFAPKQ